MRVLRTLSPGRALAPLTLLNALALLGATALLALATGRRVAVQEDGQVLALAAVALSLAIALWSLLASCAAARSVRVLTGIVQHLAAGQTDIAVPLQGRHDEVGRMAEALEHLRGIAADAFLKVRAFQQTKAPVLVLGSGGNPRIVVLNPAARALIAGAEAGVPLSEVLPLPPSVVAALADPDRLPVRERVFCGDEVLDLFAIRLQDENGRAAGAMIVLYPRTHQVALATRFEREVGAVVVGLSQDAEAMRCTAEAMDRTAAVTGDLAARMAAASEQASDNVGQVAATAEQLAASVAEIARQVAEGARIADEASVEASAMDTRVGELSEAASRIGSVVCLIGDVAARTNLLALNATIEAARAGDAGRGFAVVAGEVKTLASQTARAAQDIAGQIAAMQGRTGEAVTALRGITDTIARLNGIAAAIAGAVEQQGAATQEIARAVQQAASGTRGVTASLEDVAAAIGQTRAQAAAVLSRAAELTGRSSSLRAETEGFLATVQAA